ncbi:MAG: hypothetical protein GKR87_16535 [Kiritimatiellae bacterium]|nr:hypothetical protein [Kiritimatiellia bacterium]
MNNKEYFDFWYAVSNTQILKMPSRILETFGNTVVNYYLLTELMDATNKVRIREGRIEAFRPQIITPQLSEESLLENFGEEAGQYMEWLRAHEKEWAILQYGFAIRKHEVNENFSSGKLEAVAEQIQAELEKKNDPLSALLVGVDEPWEVCLLKLLVESMKRSAPTNLKELRRDPDGAHHDIEKSFDQASKDPSQIENLSRTLHKHELFEAYEDRFFSLVKSKQ